MLSKPSSSATSVTLYSPEANRSRARCMRRTEPYRLGETPVASLEQVAEPRRAEPCLRRDGFYGIRAIAPFQTFHRGLDSGIVRHPEG